MWNTFNCPLGGCPLSISILQREVVPFFIGGSFIGGSFLGSSFIRGSFIGGSFIGGSFIGESFIGGSFIGGSFIGGSFIGVFFSRRVLYRRAFSEGPYHRLHCKMSLLHYVCSTTCHLPVSYGYRCCSLNRDMLSQVIHLAGSLNCLGETAAFDVSTLRIMAPMYLGVSVEVTYS